MLYENTVMLVDVIELNRFGVRIPRAERQGLMPVRASITIDRMWSDRDREEAPVHASLERHPLEPLYNCRVKYWRRRSLVLVGQQYADLPRRNTRGRFEQVWWVRIVGAQL